MNTLPIVKHSHNYKSHLTPIAPAPIIAPRPVQVLPKTINNNSNNNNLQPQAHELTRSESSPCIITSKQWVLPPRPKAGRKPLDKKKRGGDNNNNNNNNNDNPMTHLSNNLVNLNLYKTQNNQELKHQLETATEENHKLKTIISRLKKEIDQLTVMKESNVSSPSSTTATTTTIDPKEIDMLIKETLPTTRKRQYKKKNKELQKSLSNTLPDLDDSHHHHQAKKLKSVGLERAMSLQVDLQSNSYNPFQLNGDDNNNNNNNGDGLCQLCGNDEFCSCLKSNDKDTYDEFLML